LKKAYDLLEAFEESQGIKPKGKVNVGMKYKDNSQRRKKFSSYKSGNSKGISGSASESKKKSSESKNKKRACFICQSDNHLLSDCPYNSYKSKEKEAATVKKKQTNIATTTAVEFELPTVKTILSGEDENVEVNVLFDIGSDMSLIRAELTDFATEIFPNQITFAGVGSQGTCSESGNFELLLGKDYVSVEMSLVDSMPKGIDCILGLDSGLTLVDLEERTAKVRGSAVSFNILKDQEQTKTSLPEITEKYSQVFAVENWLSTSNLPAVPIELVKKPTPVKVNVMFAPLVFSTGW
jgi:hypothetical protein